MAETYTWHARDCHVEGSILDGLSCLFNGTTHDSLEILRVRVVQVGERATYASAFDARDLWTISRSSEAADGVSVPIAAIDSANAAPSSALVECLRDPTYAAPTDTIRQVNPRPIVHTNVTTITINQSLFGSRKWQALWGREGNSAVEPLVLRPGNSLRLNVANCTQPRAVRCHLEFSIGSSDYRVATKIFHRAPGQTMLALTNKTGSGVVVRVRYVGISEMGNTWNNSLGRSCHALRLVLSRGKHPLDSGLGSTQAIPLSHGGLTAPATIKGYVGPLRALALGEAESPGLIDLWELNQTTATPTSYQMRIGVARTQWHPNNPTSTAETAQQFQAPRALDEGLIWRARSGSGLIVRPGYGIGIHSGNPQLSASPFADPFPILYDIAYTFLRYPGRAPRIGTESPLLRGGPC